MTDAAGSTPLQVALLNHSANVALIELLSGRGPANPPGTVCDHCGKSAAELVRSLKVCGNCHAARYCNEACQMAARAGHKPECDVLRAKRRGR